MKVKQQQQQQKTYIPFPPRNEVFKPSFGTKSQNPEK